MSLFFYIVLSIVIAIVLILWLFGGDPDGPRRFEVVSPVTARLKDVPGFVDALERTGSNGSFVVFLGPTREPDSSDAPHLQFSIEDDRLGFDWVLLAPANIRDRRSFESLARDMRISLSAKRMNKLEYLRTEDQRGAELCRRTLTDLYKATDDTLLDVVCEGFEW